MKNIISITKTIVITINLKAILSVLLVFIAALSFAQKATNESIIAPEKLRQDFQILRASLEEGYPGINTYHSKKFLDSLFIVSEKTTNLTNLIRQFRGLYNVIIGTKNYLIEPIISYFVIIWCLPFPKSINTAALSLVNNLETSSIVVPSCTIG